MNGPWYLKNGQLESIDKAVIGIDDINFAYGFGVYETLKVRNGVLYFPDLHMERLRHSANMIGLALPWTDLELIDSLHELVTANANKNSNLKLLLLASDSSDRGVDLYMIELNPLFPKHQDYQHGAKAILYEGERQLPQAKTLNMLISSMAYRKARELGAYDALLVDRNGYLTEGTRTNLFWVNGDQLFTTEEALVLAGVTRLTVMRALQAAGLSITEQKLHCSELAGGIKTLSLFVTSTSTKIMPLARVDDRELAINPLVFECMKIYKDWLANYAASQTVIVP